MVIDTKYQRLEVHSANEGSETQQLVLIRSIRRGIMDPQQLLPVISECQAEHLLHNHQEGLEAQVLTRQQDWTSWKQLMAKVLILTGSALKNYPCINAYDE